MPSRHARPRVCDDLCPRRPKRPFHVTATGSAREPPCARWASGSALRCCATRCAAGSARWRRSLTLQTAKGPRSETPSDPFRDVFSQGLERRQPYKPTGSDTLNQMSPSTLISWSQAPPRA